MWKLARVDRLLVSLSFSVPNLRLRLSIWLIIFLTINLTDKGTWLCLNVIEDIYVSGVCVEVCVCPVCVRKRQTKADIFMGMYIVCRNKETSELTVQLIQNIQRDTLCVFDVFLTKRSPDKFVGAMISALPLIQAQALAGSSTGQKVESSQY